MNREQIINIFEKIPKHILINCIEQFTTGKKKSNLLLIPGAKYYDIGGTKYFSIKITQDYVTNELRDLRAILKNNTLSELDSILLYLGDKYDYESEQNGIHQELYEEDYYAEKFGSIEYSAEYKALKNKKLLKIRDLVKNQIENPRGNCISRSQVPLRDYQVKAINFIGNPTQKSLLIVHGTGTGKTLTALAASQCYLDNNPEDKVVVISPASLTGNFEKEMKKYGGNLSAQYSFYSFDKFSSLNKGSYVTGFDLFYEDSIDEERKTFPDDSPDELKYKINKQWNKMKGSVTFLPIIKDYIDKANKINLTREYDCKNTMVIIDEAHNMRNMGIRYDAVFKCVRQSKKLLLLTATPFVNTLHDFVPIINLLYRDEKILEKSKSKIPQKITTEDKYFKALDNIYNMIRGKVTYLNEKSSEFFPSVKIHKKEINMTTSYFKKYKNALVTDRVFGDTPEVFFNGFRRAVNKVGAEEYVNEKLDIILDLVKQGRQTLVFTNWIEAGVNVLTHAFDENEITYLIVSGDISPKKRLQIVEEFNNYKVQVLIITLAGSEGLDLKAVRDVIILDPVWNGAVMEQIIGRAVRFKSHAALPVNERKVDVYQLILKTPEFAEVPSGDEILYKFIYQKQKQQDDIIKVLKNASI